MLSIQMKEGKSLNLNSRMWCSRHSAVGEGEGEVGLGGGGETFHEGLWQVGKNQKHLSNRTVATQLVCAS